MTFRLPNIRTIGMIQKWMKTLVILLLFRWKCAESPNFPDLSLFTGENVNFLHKSHIKSPNSNNNMSGRTLDEQKLKYIKSEVEHDVSFDNGLYFMEPSKTIGRTIVLFTNYNLSTMRHMEYDGYMHLITKHYFVDVSFIFLTSKLCTNAMTMFWILKSWIESRQMHMNVFKNMNEFFFADACRCTRFNVQEF
jgi:hypothetical protein